jgi:flagellar basal body-associated protein FliL
MSIQLILPLPKSSWEERIKMVKDISPSITIISLGISVVIMIITVGGATWHLSSAINDSRYESSQQVSNIAARQSADEERIAALEKTANEHYASESAFETEMRANNTVILQALADLKVQVAIKERR